MTETLPKTLLPPPFPDHTQLPESDGTFVKNFQEHPQSILLTDSLLPTLAQLHPDGQYCIGQDSGIYWRETDPPERGAEAPDWFYVPGVPPTLDEYRRSYVLWRELKAPVIALEFASGDGSEERDKTPLVRATSGETQKPGKFWVYEQIIRIPYYGIFEVKTNQLEVYHWVDFTYQKLTPNDRGHYPIPLMNVELGLWQGSYLEQNRLWLRWWDSTGNLLLTGNERAELEHHRAEEAQQQAKEAQQQAKEAQQQAKEAQQQAKEAQQQVEQERHRAEEAERRAARLVELLRSQGIDPNTNAS
jgi:Uma2 family endonuclease